VPCLLTEVRFGCKSRKHMSSDTQTGGEISINGAIIWRIWHPTVFWSNKLAKCMAQKTVPGPVHGQSIVHVLHSPLGASVMGAYHPCYIKRFPWWHPCKSRKWWADLSRAGFWGFVQLIRSGLRRKPWVLFFWGKWEFENVSLKMWVLVYLLK